jgi:hypothetical protein
LGLGGVIPKSWNINLLFYLSKLIFFAIYIKDAPVVQVYDLLNPVAFVSILQTYVNFLHQKLYSSIIIITAYTAS